MDIIPTDLATYGEEAKNLLQDLQSRNERMFLVTVLVENIAAKRQKLFNDIFAASGVAQKYNCALKRLDYQQEQGLMSSLALGTNQIEIERGLTTSSTAIFVPFTTCELFQEEMCIRDRRMPSAELEKAVNERGISSRTMRTAKSRIGDRLVTEKDGTAWVCYLRD